MIIELHIYYFMLCLFCTRLLYYYKYFIVVIVCLLLILICFSFDLSVRFAVVNRTCALYIDLKSRSAAGRRLSKSVASYVMCNL